MTFSWKGLLRVLLCTFPLLVAASFLENWWSQLPSVVAPEQSIQTEQLDKQTTEASAQNEAAPPRFASPPTPNLAPLINNAEITNLFLSPAASTQIASTAEKPDLLDLVASSNLLVKQMEEQQTLQAAEVDKYSKQATAYKGVMNLLTQRRAPQAEAFTEAYNYAEKALAAAEEGELEIAKLWGLVASIKVHHTTAVVKRSKNIHQLENAYSFALQAATALDAKVGSYWGMAAAFQTYSALSSDLTLKAKFNVASQYTMNAAKAAELGNFQAATQWEKAALNQNQAIHAYKTGDPEKEADYEKIGVYLSRAADASEKENDVDPRNWTSGIELEHQAAVTLQALSPDLTTVSISDEPSTLANQIKGSTAQFWTWAANYRFGMLLARDASRLDLVDLFDESERDAIAAISMQHTQHSESMLSKLFARHQLVADALLAGDLEQAKQLELVVRYGLLAVDALKKSKLVSYYWDKAAEYQSSLANAQQAGNQELVDKFSRAVEMTIEATAAATHKKEQVAEYWLDAAESIFSAGIALAGGQLELAAEFTKASEFMVEAAIDAEVGKVKQANRWHWLAASVRLAAEAIRDGKPMLAQEFSKVTHYAKLTNDALRRGNKEVAQYWNWAANCQKEAAILMHTGSSLAITEFKEAVKFAEQAANSYLEGKVKVARLWGTAARLMTDAAGAIENGNLNASATFRQQVSEVILEIARISNYE